MKKGLENLSESTITLDKSEIFYSNNKEAKKLIHLPYYKLEELKNKEMKKSKPLPKVKKREDHNMPKVQKNSELKSKKKKIILKKNPEDSINLDLNCEKNVLRKISGFSNDNNIVEAIFSEENLLNNKKPSLTTKFDLNKSPTKNTNLKKDKNSLEFNNKVTFENDILKNINLDPIEKNESIKINNNKNFQNNVKTKNTTNSSLNNKNNNNLPINEKNINSTNNNSNNNKNNINKNNNNSPNASNFNLPSFGKGAGDRLKNLKYAEDQIKIKKSRLSRKQRRLQDAENTLASFLSKEDKLNLFNFDEGLHRLNSNISKNSKYNMNNNFINNLNSNNYNKTNQNNNNISNNLSHQNSLGNHINNLSNNLNNNDTSVLNQTNILNNIQANQTNLQNNKNDHLVLGKKKKRISLCKKAIYKYRFKKKQFLVSNIFNFENKEIPDNKILKLETIKEIENENYDNIISDCNPNLPLSETTQNLLESSKEEESKRDLTFKKLESEKKAIKMMLNFNNKSLSKTNKNHVDNLNLLNKVEKSQDLANEVENTKNIDKVIENQSFHNKSTNLQLSEAKNYDDLYKDQSKKIDINENEIKTTPIINNNVFNYYNFNLNQSKIKDNNNYDSRNQYDFPYGVYNTKKQNYKPKINYKYMNFNQMYYNYPNYMNPCYPYWYGNFNSFYSDPHSQSTFVKFYKNTSMNKFNSSCPGFDNNNNNNPYNKEFNKDLYNNNFYNSFNNFLYNNPYNLYYSDNQIYNNGKNNICLQNNSYNNNLKKSSQVDNRNIFLENDNKNSKTNKFIFENFDINNSDNRINDYSFPNKNNNSKKKNKSRNKNNQKDINKTNQNEDSKIDFGFKDFIKNNEPKGFLFESALKKSNEKDTKIDEEYKLFLESTYKLETDITNLNGKEFNDYLKEHNELRRLNFKNIQKLTNPTIVKEFIEKYEGILPGTNIGKKFIREYVDQILSKDFDKKFSDFIVKLRDIYFKKKQAKPSKAKKRFIVGFREVYKKIKLGDAKMIFIIPNIEKIEGKNGLDEKLLDIFKVCKEKNVPIFFGLNKFKLGQISRNKHSCISILSIVNVEGFEHELEDLIKYGMQFKNQFYEKFAENKESFKDNKFVDIDKFK